MSKQLQEALNIANNKWVLYEQEYILPCFELARLSGINLREEMIKAPGTNCVVFLVKLLQAQIKELEQFKKDCQQAGMDRNLSDS